MLDDDDGGGNGGAMVIGKYANNFGVAWQERDETEYISVGELGKGSYGKVEKVILSADRIDYFRGKNKRLREFARKVFTGSFNEVIESASREVHNLMALRDNGICNATVACYLQHFVGRQSQRFFVVTEFVDGQTMYAISKENQKRNLRTPPDQFRMLLASAMGGLVYMHAHNVAHRDIHRPNLMVVNYGKFDAHIVFLDFGIACVGVDECRAQPLQIPEHMSPEMLRAEIDSKKLSMPEYKASDVWFLALSFFLLNRTRPLFVLNTPTTAPSGTDVLLAERDAENKRRQKASQAEIQAAIAKIIDLKRQQRKAQIDARRDLLHQQLSLLQKDASGRSKFADNQLLPQATEDPYAGHVLEQMLALDWHRRILPQVAKKYFEKYSLVTSPAPPASTKKASFVFP